MTRHPLPPLKLYPLIYPPILPTSAWMLARILSRTNRVSSPGKTQSAEYGQPHMPSICYQRHRVQWQSPHIHWCASLSSIPVPWSAFAAQPIVQWLTSIPILAAPHLDWPSMELVRHIQPGSPEQRDSWIRGMTKLAMGDMRPNL